MNEFLGMFIYQEILVSMSTHRLEVLKYSSRCYEVTSYIMLWCQKKCGFAAEGKRILF